MRTNARVMVIVMLFGTFIIGGGCNQDEQLQAIVETVQYENENISFAYPKEWLIDETSSNGFTDIHLSNKEPSDSFQCNETFVGMEIQIGHINDSGLNFEDFVNENLYAGDQSSMGLLSGVIVHTTIDGNSAFKAQHSGFESACGGAGYIIQQDDTERYIWIGLYTADEENTFLNDIINSLKIS